MPLIDAGEPAPSFSLRDQSGEPHALKHYSGRPLVLYFYPKDDTSGCTAEACAFRDTLPDFQHIKAAVLGVSPDNQSSHASFAEKHRLTFPLLVDTPGPDGTPPTCAAFGVWQTKSMYGREYMGVVRTTYLIDGSGLVVRRWDKVKVEGHVAEVLAAVKSLLGDASPAPVAVKAARAASKSAKSGKTKPAVRTSRTARASRPDQKSKGGRKGKLSTAPARKARTGVKGKAKSASKKR